MSHSNPTLSGKYNASALLLPVTLNVTQPDFWNKSTYGLDGSWPYSSDSQCSDSPGLEWVLPQYSPISRNDTFTLYLMFAPSGSNTIFVPLQQTDWEWGETGTYSPSTMGSQFPGTWSGSGGYSYKDGWYSSTDEPEWDRIALPSDLAN